MIRETPQDFLDILKSYVPDPQKPAGTARQEFSEFFAEFQPDERPEVEQVAIRDDLRGVWCSVPEVGAGSHPPLFPRRRFLCRVNGGSPWILRRACTGHSVPGFLGRLPAGTGAYLPGAGGGCGCRIPLPCQPRLPSAPDYSGWHIFGGHSCAGPAAFASRSTPADATGRPSACLRL